MLNPSVMLCLKRDLRCTSYTDLYCRDFPLLFAMYDDISQVTEGEVCCVWKLFTCSLALQCTVLCMQMIVYIFNNLVKSA